MKYYSILNISMQQIQIFLKCCQYQNYSRVAEEYNFTPSMISKTVKALDEGVFDLVITWSGEKPYFNNRDTEWATIFRSPAAVFIPRGVPLFEKEIHSFGALRSCPFITLSPEAYPHYYDFLQKICLKHGFSPVISTICGSTESARYNLNLGKGVYVASSLICSDWESEDVRKIELDGEGNADLLVVWKKNHLTPKMKYIIDKITH